MARRAVTGQKPGATSAVINKKVRTDPEDEPKSPPPRLAMNIQQFCNSVGISEDFFYKLKRQGKAPRLMKVGARTLVSIEAANQWCIEHEAEAAGKVEA
jgi:predicted DNA-binding transcriptional regulator AlpA